MAVNYMTSVNINTYDPIIEHISFEYDQSLVYVSTELTSDPIIMPNNINQIAVTLAITAGSGKVQTTTNKLADVISGTSVVWHDWELGSIIATDQDVAAPVTAMRFICTTGIVRVMIKAQ